MRRRDVMMAAAVAAGALGSSGAMAASPTSTVRLVKLKFKPGGRRIWEDWSAELEQRRAEVLETLKNEGVSSEACFLSDDGEHVFYFMEVADMEKANAAFAKSHFPIDAEHAVKKGASLELVTELKPLFAFQNHP